MDSNENKIYDVIIIGAGASGLYAGAQIGKSISNNFECCGKIPSVSGDSSFSGLIIEKHNSPGKKILMSGGGQCNLTRGGDIKDFINHYGNNGKKIRSLLYKHNNKSVSDYFEKLGLPLTEREDNKIFPKSLNSKDVVSVLIKEIQKNGFEVKYGKSVTDIIPLKENVYNSDGDDDFCCTYDDNMAKSDKTAVYSVLCGASTFKCHKLIVATGGCSYPSTGSDGSIFPILESLGLSLIPRKQALVPIFVQDYLYGHISGVSLPQIELTISETGKRCIGDLLLTHTGLSGPVILNSSRYLDKGNKFSFNYFPGKTTNQLAKELKQLAAGNNKRIDTAISEYSAASGYSLPKRFLEILLGSSLFNGKTTSIEAIAFPKFSLLSGNQIDDMAKRLTCDTFSVSELGSYNTAMVTAGGVSLEEINFKNMESKKYPHLHIIGESLDIDGDTGGYNLQFAFSSAYAAAK